MNRARSPLLEAWRETRAGFSPLFLEPIMKRGLEHLAEVSRPGAVLLDLGSGSGHVALALRTFGCQTLCLEIDREVLQLSQRRYPGGSGIVGRAETLPLADHSVDGIFCFSVLQYADRRAAIAEMHRVLKPRGRVVVVENLAGSPVAKAYRLWRWLMRVRYPKRLTPIRHVSWNEGREMFADFPGARLDAFYLFSAALLALPRVYRADALEPAGSPIRAVLELAHRLDSFLLSHVPACRRAAWMLLLRG